MKQYGLALAGGGTRGAAHVGVLKALKEAKLLPEALAGTSAGSIVAGLYAAGLDVEELEEIVIDLSSHGLCFLDPDFAGILKFIPQMVLHRKVSLSGLLKGNRLKKLFCMLTEKKKLKDACIGLVIPAVDILSGNTIAYTNFPAPVSMEQVKWEFDGEICEVMIASSSVPGVFRPRKIGSYQLVDGGVTNNLPVDLLRAAGQRHVVAVDIGQDYHMPMDESVMEILSHSFSVMSRSLKNCMSEHELISLKPSLPEGAGLLTFEHMIGCMEAGYEYTKERIPQIKKILE